MDAIICPRCGKENDPQNQFCGKCGLEFAKVSPDQPSEADLVPCHWHAKEPTALRCGKCDRPICHKCVVMSPAGTRCRECSKSNVPVRPEAIVYEAKKGFFGILSHGWISIWIVLILLSVVSYSVSAIWRMMNPPTIEVPLDGRSSEGDRFVPDSSL